MIIVKIAIIASRKRIDRMVKTSRIESLITLRTHRAIRYPPMPTPRATPIEKEYTQSYKSHCKNQFYDDSRGEGVLFH